MDEQVIFIILAVAFWILRAVFSNKENTPKKRTKQPAAPQQNKPKRGKSFQEIIEDLVKEVKEKTETPPPATPRAEPVLTHTSAKPQKSKTLDWQKVDRTKLKDKAQLIYHEDYHSIHKEESATKPIENVDEIVKSEGKVYHFDRKSINWKDAIIAKEILERKYV